MSIRNFTFNWPPRAIPATAFLIAAVIAATTMGSEAASQPRCKPVNGHLEEEQVTPLPALTTTGRMIGGIQGQYNFTLTSATASTTPGVVLFTGASVINTAKGDLHLTEAGALDTFSPGNFADLLTITGGTGTFTGASGQVVLFGNFDLAAGSGASDYQGAVCTP